MTRSVIVLTGVVGLTVAVLTGAGEFAAAGKEAGVVNKRYSIAPLTAL